MKNKYLICIIFLLFSIFLNAQVAGDSLSRTGLVNALALPIPNASFETPLVISSNTTETVLQKVDLQNGANIDATRLMQSKLPGLNILANSYTPGASSRMNFRGYRSVLNSSEPLILLNGIPINNSEFLNGIDGTDQSNRLIDLDPHFIENVEFIGSAAGRARYGIVGANGILSIHTKTDSSKKLRIGFSSSIMNGNVSRLPELQNTRAQGRIVNGEARYLGPETANGFSWGPLVSKLYYDNFNESLFDKNGVITSEVTNNPVNTYDPYLFFQNSWTQNHSLRISKSTSIISTTVVGSYANETGVIPTNQFRRYNLGANVGIRPIKNLTLNVNAALSGSNATRSIKGSSLNGIMLGLLRTAPTFDNANGLEDPLNDETSYLLDNGDQRSYRAGIYDNPYRSLNEIRNVDNVSRRIVQLSGKYDLSNKWSFLFNSGIDNFQDYREGGRNIDPSPFRPDLGGAYERTIDFASSHIGVSSVYNYLSTDQLNLDFTVGYEYNQNSVEMQLLEGRDLTTEGNITLANAATIETFTSFSDFKRAGGFFATDFKLGDLLDLNASIRHDYSNKFGSSTNGFTSWGIGGRFNVIQVRDSVSAPYLNIALVSSIGRSGNNENFGNNTGLYVPASIAGDGFISAFSENGFEPNDTGRSNLLTAESTLAFDVGIAVNYKNRIRSKITFYNEQSAGLHLIQGISSTSGLSNNYANLGAITNRGVDLSLEMNLVKTRAFDWSFDIHFNKNNNKVTTLDGTNESINLGPFAQSNSAAIEGHSYGVFQARGFERNESGQMIIGDDGWPLVSTDLQVLADPNPDWMMFFGNTITLFERLTLSTLIEFKQGGDVYCGTCGVLDYFGRTQRAISEIDQTLVFEGVTSTGQVNTTEVELAPSAGTYSDFYRVRYGFGGIGEMSIYDASWIKLRNLSLTYDLTNLLKLKNSRSVSLGFTMENFILSTSFPGIDPETNLMGNSGAIGIDYFNNPGMERYGLHLKLNI